MGSPGDQILDAAHRCRQRWGIAKVTMDDIVAESGVSRATIYRLFPGGKDVLFEALRVRSLEEFFERLRAEIQGAESLEDLLVSAVVCATRELRADSDLAIQLSTEAGETVSELTVAGLPRIIRMANALLLPFAAPFIEVATARAMIDALARLVISMFLAPSDHLSFDDEDAARSIIRPLIQAFIGPGQQIFTAHTSHHVVNNTQGE